jgi:2-oxoglutarate ferredoxin oxidoreductase subunit alpha
VSFSKWGPKSPPDPAPGARRYAIVQAEDELAAIGMVIGASWNGARSFTATSGPGVSLMNEFLGLAYFAEIPTVLIDVQRTGPSTGMPTRTQQSDVLLAAYASHGDTKHVLLFPASPKECFDLTADAFDLAERLQTPVIVMTDLDLGMNDHVSPPLEWDENRTYDRGKVLTAAELQTIAEWKADTAARYELEENGNGSGQPRASSVDSELDAQTNGDHAASQPLEQFKGKFGRYLDIDGDGIPYRTIPGTHPSKGSYVTRGTSRDEYAAYTEDGDAYRKNMDRLLRKWDTGKTLVPAPQFYQTSNAAKHGVLFFGTSTYAAEEAIEMFKNEGIDLDAMRVRSFPFAGDVEEFVDSHEVVFVIEQNRDAQFKSLMTIELGTNPAKLVPVLNYDGTPITAAEIFDQIAQAIMVHRSEPALK